MPDTRDESYAHRLKAKEGVWWKQMLDVQAPYRWNLRRQQLGRTLDIGCGIGRNLPSLAPESLGVDHNVESVAEARRRGFRAVTVEEWLDSPLRVEESFDSLLLAHVVEHMSEADAKSLLQAYLPQLKPGGRIFFICPQERGFASDETHVWFADGEALARLARSVGLVPDDWFSFPFPRALGRVFTYNEFCLLAHKQPGD